MRRYGAKTGDFGAKVGSLEKIKLETLDFTMVHARDNGPISIPFKWP